VSGPRVLAGGGSVVLPWREDLHYTPRKAGYHGGASLAEVTVPVLVLVPSVETVPAGWSVLPVEAVTPGRWQNNAPLGPVETSAAGSPDRVPAVSSTRTGQGKARAPQGDTLFDVAAGGSELEGHEPVPHGPVPHGSVRRAEATLSSSAAAVQTRTPWGGQVVAAEVYALQESFVRKHPDRQVVAQVIDALVAAGGTLSLAAVAARVGRA
jgi:hypothetical protein